MANNKVQLSDGTVLIDITDSTADPSNVLRGVVAYAADGTRVVGEVEMPDISGKQDKAVQYTATVSTSSWTQNSTSKLYYKSVTVSGLLASYAVSPDVDIDLSGKNATDAAALMSAFANITYITTAANSITLYATAKPSVSLPLVIRVFP